MVPKVSSVYPVSIRKHDHRQANEGAEKKEQDQFKDILAKALMSKKA